MGDEDRVDKRSEREYPGGRGKSRGDLVVKEEVGARGRRGLGDNVVIVGAVEWRGEKTGEEGEEEGVGRGVAGEGGN